MIWGVILALSCNPVPCVEQAEELLGKLTRSAAIYLKKGAEGFDPTRNLRVQAALFREDLVWQTRGFTDRQIDLMVFISVALSLERADKALEEAWKDPKNKARAEAIKLYRMQAESLLDDLSEKLRDIPDHEFRFYF